MQLGELRDSLEATVILYFIIYISETYGPCISLWIKSDREKQLMW